MLWTKRISSEQRKNNRLSLASSEIKTLLIFVFFTNERTLFKTNNNKSIIKSGHNLWCCLFDGHKSDNTFNCRNVNKINFCQWFSFFRQNQCFRTEADFLAKLGSKGAIQLSQCNICLDWTVTLQTKYLACFKVQSNTKVHCNILGDLSGNPNWLLS
jgi:hypothetical protein